MQSKERCVEARARITSKGQVTIPAEVRRLMGARDGDRIIFEVEGEEVRVRLERERTSFADYAGIWREGEGRSGEEIDAYIRRMRGHSQ